MSGGGMIYAGPADLPPLDEEEPLRPTAGLLEGVSVGPTAGLLEGDAPPIAASDPYPFRDHRSMADLIALEQGAREAERADVLAYLARKRASAALVAKRSPEHAEHAATVIRQCDIFADDLRGGLHEGDAAIVAALGIGADQLPGHADPVLGKTQDVMDAALAFAIGAAAFALGVLSAGQF